MTVGELIELLKKFPEHKTIQMRDCTGDWSIAVEADIIGQYVYIDSMVTDESVDSDLKGLAAMEAQR